MYNATVKSIFFIEREVAKLMKKKHVKNQSIVNITSIHTEIIRDIVHYSSAKASMKMITKEFAYKLSSYGIRVNSIEPGSIDTPLLRRDLNSKELIEEAHIGYAVANANEKLKSIADFVTSNEYEKGVIEIIKKHS